MRLGAYDPGGAGGAFDDQLEASRGNQGSQGWESVRQHGTLWPVHGCGQPVRTQAAPPLRMHVARFFTCLWLASPQPSGRALRKDPVNPPLPVRRGIAGQGCTRQVCLPYSPSDAPSPISSPSQDGYCKGIPGDSGISQWQGFIWSRWTSRTSPLGVRTRKTPFSNPFHHLVGAQPPGLQLITPHRGRRYHTQSPTAGGVPAFRWALIRLAHFSCASDMNRATSSSMCFISAKKSDASWHSLGVPGQAGQRPLPTKHYLVRREPSSGFGHVMMSSQGVWQGFDPIDISVH